MSYLPCRTQVVLPVLMCCLRAAAADIDYLTQVKPVLAEKCYSCHGVLKQEGGLRLETISLMVSGGDSGPALAAGNAKSSLIIERITAEHDVRMPPEADGAALKPKQIDVLRSWIDQGAMAPDEATPAGPGDHWAFQRISKPGLPLVQAFAAGTTDAGSTDSDTGNTDAALLNNPIDMLLNARLQQQGLKPVPAAERSLLIRRLYLDLIGLPPSLKQLHDERPWTVIVDELLTSPQHGERWGRHWMDVWRYTDWYGLGAQLRYSQKHIWRWRDWIVNSLNEDKGYDRMIHEMLAGDEIAPDDPDVIAGTGFLARNYYLFNRTTWLDSTIEHTGKAFLGLTLNCAKCHDHKYDPITHIDYYSFRAIFEPHQVRLDPVPGVTDFEVDGLPRVFDDHLDAETFLHLRGDPLNPDKTTKIQPRVPALLAGFQPEVQPISLPPTAYAPGLRDYVQRDYQQAAEADVAAAEKELTAASAALARHVQDTSDVSDPATGDVKKAMLFEDDFSAANPEAWEIVGDDWQFHGGALLRTSATRKQENVRFRKPLPRDFEVACRYTTTGGATYKSVTFRFDESHDGKYANYVYTSAHEPGPKVQVAYSRDGNSVYPSDGAASRPIAVGQTYELRFAVRDRLVNVWLDNEFVLAYELPDRRSDGRLTLQAFDATVAYDWIRIRSLPSDTPLVAAKNSTEAARDPRVTAETAAAKRRAAQASLDSLKAVFAADGAKYGTASTVNIAAAANEAAVKQAAAALAQAEYELLAAAEDANKVKTATAKVAAARKQIMQAEQGTGTYDSLRASLKALEGPADKEADYLPTYSETSSGRRLSLARWMTDRENPLTARVAVNHVWMRHFGTPLVESVFDFGLRSKRPVHSDVLDYLATEFIESGWSFRHLHRLIVTSDAYQRQTSSIHADPVTLEHDAANQLYWRMNTRRMESQVVRDCLLQLAGVLDLKVGGPSVDVDGASKRRSLYFKHSRDQQDRFLTMFDDADLLQCYRRSDSIVPQQALALANSELSMSMSELMATRITQSLPAVDTASFADAAVETILGRQPSQSERDECMLFCQQLAELLRREEPDAQAEVEKRVRKRLVHSLLNHNDFISIR